MEVFEKRAQGRVKAPTKASAKEKPRRNSAAKPKFYGSLIRYAPTKGQRREQARAYHVVKNYPAVLQLLGKWLLSSLSHH
jgi:hypothetical protein